MTAGKEGRGQHDAAPANSAERPTSARGASITGWIWGIVFMRKSLSLTVALALVLLTASVASAQSFSVFGGIGYGSLSLSTKLDGNISNELSEPAMALQLGGVFNLIANLGVGALYDRVASRDSMARSGPAYSESDSGGATLTGLNVIVKYGFDVSGAEIDVFGGAGNYAYSTSRQETVEDSTEKRTYSQQGELDSRALGFIGGARVKAPVASDMYLTGTLAYRSVRWTNGKFESRLRVAVEDQLGKTEGSIVLDEEFQSLGLSGWSLGLGLSYEF